MTPRKHRTELRLCADQWPWQALQPLHFALPCCMYRSKYGAPADVFSFAVILWEIVTLKDPRTQGLTETYQLQQHAQGHRGRAALAIDEVMMNMVGGMPPLVSGL